MYIMHEINLEGATMKIFDNTIRYELLSSESKNISYQLVNKENDRDITCRVSFEECGYKFLIEDKYQYNDNNKVTVQRKIEGKCYQPIVEKNGIRFNFLINISNKNQNNWRFCIPSIYYTKPLDLNQKKTLCFMEERLTANLVIAYNETESEAYVLSKCNTASKTEMPKRNKGDSSYLHKTEVGSLGYRLDGDGNLNLLAYWPYYEGDKSVAIDSNGTAASAYYPLDGNNINIVLEYTFDKIKADSYTESIYKPFRHLAKSLDNGKNNVATLPFSSEESIEYRLESLGKCYNEFGIDGAGFLFHYDPQLGLLSLSGNRNN